MPFVKAEIPIGNMEAFNELKGAIDSAFSPANVDAFFRSIGKRGLRARQFEQVRDAGLLDAYNGGRSVVALWQALPVSDQGQVRELYLTAVDQVAPATRQKHKQLYAYA